MAGAIAEINSMVAKGDSKNTLQALQLPSAGLRAVRPECADTYQNKLAQSQAKDANKGNLVQKSEVSHFSGCGFMVAFVLCALLQAAVMVFGSNIVSVTHITITTTWRQDRVRGKSQRDFITEVTISVEKRSRCFCCHSVLSWLPAFAAFQFNFALLLSQICVKTIIFLLQDVVSSVTAEYNREQLWLANESLVTQLQARIRGFLVRKRHKQRMEYLQQQEPRVVKLQVGSCSEE